MAHSTQVFKGRSEVMNDLDLMVIFMFLPDATSPDASAEVPRFAAWEHTLRHYGPGLIQLELDTVLVDEADALRFATGLRRVRARLSAFGQHIPSHLLNARNITPGVIFADFPVAIVVDSAMRIEKLVSVETATTAVRSLLSSSILSCLNTGD